MLKIIILDFLIQTFYHKIRQQFYFVLQFFFLMFLPTGYIGLLGVSFGIFCLNKYGEVFLFERAIESLWLLLSCAVPMIWVEMINRKDPATCADSKLQQGDGGRHSQCGQFTTINDLMYAFYYLSLFNVIMIFGCITTTNAIVTKRYALKVWLLNQITRSWSYIIGDFVHILDVWRVSLLIYGWLI